MQIIYYGCFLIATHFILMQIFRLTTYHKYFLPALPILILYSAAVGWALFALRFHQFFLWQVILASVWLFVVARSQSAQLKLMLDAAGSDANLVRLMAESSSRTASFYAYSAFIYVITFSGVYLYLYNRSQ